MLYLLEGTNHYKVGYTKDLNTLKNRLASYRTHNPDFKLIGLQTGNKEDEKLFHSNMKKEWMEKDEDFEFIAKNFNLTENSPEIILSSALNGLRVVKIKELPEGEISTEVYNAIIGDSVYIFAVQDKCLYIASRGKIYGVIDAKITKEFYTDYNEYNERYWGFIINDNQLLCNFRCNIDIGMGLRDEFIMVDSKSPLFNKLKNYNS